MLNKNMHNKTHFSISQKYISNFYINSLHREAFREAFALFGPLSVYFGCIGRFGSLASGGLLRFQFLPRRLKKGMDKKIRRYFVPGGETNPTIPVMSYTDLLIQKKQIMQENKNKSGIYRLVNKTNGKIYIGSSVNMSSRFYKYYNITYITKFRKNSLIHKAFLKYGYSNFCLEILEYCKPLDVVKREQYYIDLLKPGYNILQKAGSLLGFKHSEETLAKMKERKHSEETLAKMKERKHSEETRAKISIAKAGKPKPEGAGKPSQRIEVIDIQNHITTKYDSMALAALALDIKPSQISMFFNRNQKKPYQGRYIFKKL